MLSYMPHLEENVRNLDLTKEHLEVIKTDER
jgi:hypothetical protein